MKAIYRNLLVVFLFLFAGVAAYAQPSVKGKVTDIDGQPLPGVAVMLKGTTLGVVTDVDGNFTMTIPQQQKIIATEFLKFGNF